MLPCWHGLLTMLPALLLLMLHACREQKQGWP
jgi:hypothetical protein